MFIKLRNRCQCKICSLYLVVSLLLQSFRSSPLLLLIFVVDFLPCRDYVRCLIINVCRLSDSIWKPPWQFIHTGSYFQNNCCCNKATAPKFPPPNFPSSIPVHHLYRWILSLFRPPQAHNESLMYLPQQVHIREIQKSWIATRMSSRFRWMFVMKQLEPPR